MTSWFLAWETRKTVSLLSLTERMKEYKGNRYGKPKVLSLVLFSYFTYSLGVSCSPTGLNIIYRLTILRSLCPTYTSFQNPDLSIQWPIQYLYLGITNLTTASSSLNRLHLQSLPRWSTALEESSCSGSKALESHLTSKALGNHASCNLKIYPESKDFSTLLLLPWSKPRSFIHQDLCNFSKKVSLFLP